MHNSLVPASHATLIADDTLQPKLSVALLNPLSSELDAMRQTLVFQGLETIARNRNHQRPDLCLFEFGKVYRQLEEGGHTEEERLILFVTGRTHPESWRWRRERRDVLSKRGCGRALDPMRHGCDKAVRPAFR